MEILCCKKWSADSYVTLQVFVADGSVYDQVASTAVASSASTSIFFDPHRALPYLERSRHVVPPGVLFDHRHCRQVAAGKSLQRCVTLER